MSRHFRWSIRMAAKANRLTLLIGTSRSFLKNVSFPFGSRVAIAPRIDAPHVRAGGAFRGGPLDLGSQLDEVGEQVRLAAEFVRDHRWLAGDGRDDCDADTAALQRLDQRSEIAGAREQYNLVYMPGELHGIDRQFDVHVALHLAATARRRIDWVVDILKFPLIHLDSRSNWTNWLHGVGIDDADVTHGPVLNRASMVIDAAINGQGIALARTTLAAWDLINGRLVLPVLESLPLSKSYWIVALKRPRRCQRLTPFATGCSRRRRTTYASSNRSGPRSQRGGKAVVPLLRDDARYDLEQGNSVTRPMLARSHSVRNRRPHTFVLSFRFNDGEGYDHYQAYDLGRGARLQHQLGACRPLQHGKSRCRIRERPGLYRTNHRIHGN